MPIVIHDETLDRTTGARGRVGELDQAEIRALAPEVPTLDELCAWARPLAVELLLELKRPEHAPPDEALVAGSLEPIRAGGLLARTTFVSFDDLSIARLLALEPAARTGLLYGQRRRPAGWPPGVRGIHAHHSWVTAELCRVAHADGRYVHGWGMPEPLESGYIHALVAAGVDSLSANDPRQLVALLR